MMTPEISVRHLQLFISSRVLKSPVRLKDRTWLLEVALARTSMAVLMRGTLSSAEMTAARARTREIVKKVALNIFNETVRIKQSDIVLNQLIFLFKKSHLTDCCRVYMIPTITLIILSAGISRKLLIYRPPHKTLCNSHSVLHTYMHQ